MKCQRVMICAPASGSGKTQITCGLLQAFLNRGLKAMAFKCGPDFIDPMFHTKVIGAKSRNLDSFFSEEATLKYILGYNFQGSDIAVIEGVMGYYDGISAASDKGSTYELAKKTDTSVILVVDCHGASLSIIPMIKGFVEYKENSLIKGVILNKMSENIYDKIRKQIEIETGIEVLGFVPVSPDLVIQSRHLGLVAPDEIEEYQYKLGRFANLMEQTVNLDRIIQIAEDATPIEYREPDLPKLSREATIAVAKDEAFCFYYEDNLDILFGMGAKIVEFSPLWDTEVPKQADGILLGGGYPELYARQLSENKTMLNSLKHKTDDGIPLMAECGGFLYLHEWMEDMEQNEFQMAGVIPGKAYKTQKLNRFGYITLTAEYDQMVADKGMQIKGHEFHYYESTNCGDGFEAKRPTTHDQWNCMISGDNLAAGFPHLYYYSNPQIPYQFLKRCVEYSDSKKNTFE